jgi:hypothetical protein
VTSTEIESVWFLRVVVGAGVEGAAVMMQPLEGILCSPRMSITISSGSF